MGTKRTVLVLVVGLVLGLFGGASADIMWNATSPGQSWTNWNLWTVHQGQHQPGDWSHYFIADDYGATYGPLIQEGDLIDNLGLLRMRTTNPEAMLTVTMTGGTVLLDGANHYDIGFELGNGITWDMTGGLVHNLASSRSAAVRAYPDNPPAELLIGGDGVFRIENTFYMGDYQTFNATGEASIDLRDDGKFQLAGDRTSCGGLMQNYIDEGWIMGNGIMRQVVMSLVDVDGTQYTQVEAGGKIRFDSEASGLFEVAGPAGIPVSVLTIVDDTYTVDYEVTGGTATSGQDYTLSAGTLVFAPGQTTATIDIPLVSDGADEPDETIVLALSNATGGGAYLGEPTEHTFTIIDPRPEVSFESQTSSAPQNIAGPAKVGVVLSNNVFTKAVTVDYAVTGGTATSGDDYTLANGTLTFNPGQTYATIDLAIANDGSYEPVDETVEITLSNPTSSHAGGTMAHTVTIVDPRVDVGFAASAGSESEVSSNLEIPVVLSGVTGNVVTVDYAVTGGTATRDTDYILIDGTLTFAPGETSKAITASVLSDGFTDGENAETIELTLSNVTGSPANLGSQAQYTYTIINEPMEFLKVDLAMPDCGAAGTTWDEHSTFPECYDAMPGTGKEGWWPWVAPRWYDMYSHNAVWEDGTDRDKPISDGVAGTGVHVQIGTIYDCGLKCSGLTMCKLNGGCAPDGAPIHDPLCNTWFSAIDWPEFKWSTILLSIHDLPPGEYWLYSYHNSFDCERTGGSAGTGVSCTNTGEPEPLMPMITAMALSDSEDLPGTLDPETEAKGEYNHYIYRNVTKGRLPLGCGAVELIEGAYNVPVQQVTRDEDLIPSVIKFRTDGSPILVVYENGCCKTDPVRTGRSGGRAVLNAFELKVATPRSAAEAISPCDAAVEVSPLCQVLRWSPGYYATSHDLYFGTSESAVANAGKSSAQYVATLPRGAESYEPGDLKYNRTYYWRVDEVTDDVASKGGIFSFTTQTCKVVDDFERSLRFEGLAGSEGAVDRACLCDDVVYPAGTMMPAGCDWRYGQIQCWLHHTSVLGGKALTMDYYNRSGFGSFSEVGQEFAVGRDWTPGGVDMLTLSLSGATANIQDRLYLVVEDTDGAAAEAVFVGADLRNAQWQDVTIGLDELAGVDLTSVKKVFVGVGDRAGSPSGGIGTLAIDDIRLCDDGQTTGCECLGDLNSDDQVDLDDLQAVAAILLDAGAPFIVLVEPGHCADLNEDGQVDLDDLQLVAGVLLDAGSPFIVPCP